MRAKTIKHLEENIGVTLHDSGLCNRFLDMTLKAQITKRHRLEFIKSKNVYASKGIIKNGKRQPIYERKYLQIVFHKGVVSTYVKNS